MSKVIDWIYQTLKQREAAGFAKYGIQLDVAQPPTGGEETLGWYQMVVEEVLDALVYYAKLVDRLIEVATKHKTRASALAAQLKSAQESLRLSGETMSKLVEENQQLEATVAQLRIEVETRGQPDELIRASLENEIQNLRSQIEGYQMQLEDLRQTYAATQGASTGPYSMNIAPEVKTHPTFSAGPSMAPTVATEGSFGEGSFGEGSFGNDSLENILRQLEEA